MATAKISIKVDARLLDEVRRRSASFDLSAFVEEVLRARIEQMRRRPASGGRS